MFAASDPEEGAPRPVIVPPVIATLFAACVDIVPSPSDALAVDPVSATQVEPLPTIKLPSVVARFPIAVKFALEAPFASSCV